MARLKISSDEIISLLRIVKSPVFLSCIFCPAAETTVGARTACHKRALVTSETPSITDPRRSSPGAADGDALRILRASGRAVGDYGPLRCVILQGRPT